MNTLVVFELTEQARMNEFRRGLTQIGYATGWTNFPADNVTYYLPTNAMWKPNISLQDAYNEAAKCANGLGIQLRNLVAVPSMPWVAFNGTINPVT